MATVHCNGFARSTRSPSNQNAKTTAGRSVSVRYLVDLTTLPIELVTAERAVVHEPVRPARRTGVTLEQLSILG
jgi:hypothetical protein